jgi:hypothetical protein
MSVVGVILGVPRSVAIGPSEGARQALAMRFEILGDISGLETFDTGSGIREIAGLRKRKAPLLPPRQPRRVFSVAGPLLCFFK